MTKDSCQTRNCCNYWRRISQKTRSFSTKNTRGLVSRVSRNPAECSSELRVEKKDLPMLADALRLPDSFHCNQRTTDDKLEGLCILLRRMSFSCRYSDMLARFGRPFPELSTKSNTVMNYIYDLHGHKLCQWNHDILNPRYFDTYTNAISNKGAALQNCFGFIYRRND